jgi:hypothetical protein
VILPTSASPFHTVKPSAATITAMNEASKALFSRSIEMIPSVTAVDFANFGILREATGGA